MDKLNNSLQQVDENESLLLIVSSKQELLKEITEINKQIKSKCFELVYWYIFYCNRGNSNSNSQIKTISESLKERDEKDLNGILELYNKVVETINSRKETMIEIKYYLNSIIWNRNKFEEFKKKEEYVKNERLEQLIDEISKFSDKTTLSTIVDNKNV